MQMIMNFFDHPFFIIMGGLSVIAIIGSFFYVAFLVIKGVIPVWYRLGIGLSKATVAVFGDVSVYNSLRDMLVDSKMFKASNIMQVHNNDLKKASGAQVFLVHWKSFQNNISDILAIKQDYTALIVYAPVEEGRIDSATMNQINFERNAVVVNFRGRLMNDILTSLVTVGCKYKQ